MLDRCIDTSNIIKTEINTSWKKDIPIHTSWRLNERHYGKLEGVPRQHVRNMYGEKITNLIRYNFHKEVPILTQNDYKNDYPIYKNCYFDTVKYGETHEKLLERMLPYYENDICYTITQDMVPLIVTHKHTARALMKYLLQIPDKNYDNFNLPNNKILFVCLKDDFKYERHFEISY